VHERPGRAGHEAGVAGAKVAGGLAFDDEVFEDLESADFGLAGLRSGVGCGVEHHFEIGSVLTGEADVGDAHASQAGGKVGAGGVAAEFEGGGKFFETDGADGGEELGLVGEVAIGGGSGHAGAGANFAQGESADAFFGDEVEAGLDEGGAQVAVVVGLCGGSGGAHI